MAASITTNTNTTTIAAAAADGAYVASLIITFRPI